jgi:hypothetical protein
MPTSTGFARCQESPAKYYTGGVEAAYRAWVKNAGRKMELSIQKVLRGAPITWKEEATVFPPRAEYLLPREELPEPSESFSHDVFTPDL